MSEPTQSGEPEFNAESITRRSHAVFTAIFAFLWFWKIRAGLNPFNLGVDGAFYTNVAMHVRDGNGLLTDVSLYHKGFTSFPHKSSIYPVWPLIYGYLSRIISWQTVAVWVPTIGYFLTLFFAYLWGRALSTYQFFPKLLKGFGLGHVLVLIFGLHEEFFEFTTRPYTEGLAYTFLMIGLWRSVPILVEPSLKRGLELGLWMTLAFMTRSQLFLMLIAFGGVMGWMLLVTPRRLPLLACCTGVLAVFASATGLHHWYCAGAFDEWPFLALKFHNARETALLSQVQMVIPFDSWSERILDAAKGLLVSFAWEGEYAYARSFHWFQYSALAVVPYLCFDAFRWLRDREVRKNTANWLRSPAAFPWIFAVLLAFGGFFSIYLFHKQYFASWNFARRHGLISGLMFAFCFYRLCRGTGVIWRGAACLLIGAATITGFAYCIRPMVLQLEGPYERKAVLQSDVVEWVQKRADQREQLIVATMALVPQEASVFTRNVGYHWFYERTTGEDILKMFEELGAEYLIAPRYEEGWLYSETPEPFSNYFEHVHTTRLQRIYRYIESAETDSAGPSDQD